MFIQTTLNLALAALLATPLAAQDHLRGGGQGMGPHPEGGPMMLMRGLNLTEAQKAEMKLLGEKHRTATKAKQEAAMAAHEALHGAMLDPASSLEQLKALHEKASQAQFELALDHRAMLQEALALLTPEQKAKAEQLRAEHMKHRPMGPGEGHRHGKGHEAGSEVAPPEKK